uniref:Uncharacterized protein n=1 Tax=Aegilops tauschii TaxID=37682 RepID=M8BZY1_AEGTA
MVPQAQADDDVQRGLYDIELTHATQSPQQAPYKFSLLDRAGVPAYELPAETGSFTGVFPNVHAPYNPVIGDGDGEEPGPGCGHDESIRKEELERCRGDLIRDYCIMIRLFITLPE